MKQTVFVFAAVLCVLLAGCGRTEVGETAPAPEETTAPAASSAPAEESIFPSPSQPVPAQSGEEPSANSQLLPGDEGKEVWNTKPPSPYGEYYSDIEAATQNCEETAVERGTDLVPKITVLEEEMFIQTTDPMQNRLLTDWPYFYIQVRSYTEAVRKMDVSFLKNDDYYFALADSDYYYVMYDSNTGVRAYLFFVMGDYFGAGKCENLMGYGYTLYSSQKQYYEDFAHIQVGDSMEEVYKVDPKVMEIWFSAFETPEKLLETMSEGNIYCSYHVLMDGIIAFDYSYEDGQVVVSNIVYSENGIIETRWFGKKMATVCYAIDPLDYVTKPQE